MVDSSRQAGVQEIEGNLVSEAPAAPQPRVVVGIEITPDMAKAGGQILQEEFDAAPYWSGHVARAVFRAMAKASQG